MLQDTDKEYKGVVDTSRGSYTVNIGPELDKSIKVGLREIVNLVDVVDELSGFSSYVDESRTVNGSEILSEMGKVCVEEFDDDWNSRSDWNNNAAKILKLFAGYAEHKTYPWENCSNIVLPVTTIAAIQFQARAFEALIPGKDTVKVIYTGDEDVERSDRVGKYMNWQLLYKMKEFVTGMDDTLMQSPLLGNAFKKTYYSFEKKRAVSIPISAKNLVYSYTSTSFDESLRKSHLLFLTKNQVRTLVNAGAFSRNAWNLGPGSPGVYETSTLQQARDDIQGQKKPYSTYDTPRLFIEQHRLWDLNRDGIAEPYAITVDYETGAVVRISSRSFIDAFGNTVEIECFTPYRFLPNPEGAYDFGVGTLLLGLNSGMNSILNEIVDAGSLANLQGGFISSRSGLAKGDLKFQQGTYKSVDAYTDDISKAIYSFDFKGPNATLYTTLGLLYEYSKMVSSVSETMTGQMPASDTPAQTILALLEEGKKVYGTIYKRHHLSFTEEIRKIYTLNSVFLSEREYFKVLGDNLFPEGENTLVGRSDFVGEYDVIPVSDPTVLSRAEKMLKAQQLLAEVKTNPLTANNMSALYEATKRYYKVMDVDNLDAVLPKNEEPKDISPEEENAKMLTEVMANVLPEQDHARHVKVHDDFLVSIYAQELSPNSRNLFDRHRKEHLAAAYMQGVSNGG